MDRREALTGQRGKYNPPDRSIEEQRKAAVREERAVREAEREAIRLEEVERKMAFLEKGGSHPERWEPKWEPEKPTQAFARLTKPPRGCAALLNPPKPS
eukprot:415414-Prorocentrum_minimum.AAC.11